jgi:hypothetical protein
VQSVKEAAQVAPRAPAFLPGWIWRPSHRLGATGANCPWLLRLAAAGQADVGRERRRGRRPQEAGREGDDGDDRREDRRDPGNVPPPDPGREAHREQ